MNFLIFLVTFCYTVVLGSSVFGQGSACTAQIGTFIANVTGQSNIDYVLCYGDELEINSNNNFVYANEQFNPTGPVYDPGIAWYVYSCPPTVGLVPAPGVDINNDPCLVGVWGEGDFWDNNDMFWIDNFPGVFTNNIVYFVPGTVYSITDSQYSYTNVPTPCYDMGDVYAVQYLPEITFLTIENCSTGQLSATLNGGVPAVNGSQFTVVQGSITPATAIFVNTGCGNGGSIVLGNLSLGDNYSFDVIDANGCNVTISGIMGGTENVVITYQQTNYCMNDPNPLPNLVGANGGMYSGTPGLSVNATTGEINLIASTPGLHTVTYTVPGGFCPPTSTFTLTIHPLPIVSAGPDQTVCEGAQVTLSGSGAQSYFWDNGVMNNVAFAPTVTQTFTVTGISAVGCQNTDQMNCFVSVLANPGMDNSLTICSNGTPENLFPLLGAAASPNGTWTDFTGLVVSMPYDPLTMDPGVYIYTLDSNGCTSSAHITVNELNTSVSAVTTNVSCFGGVDGSALITVTNATSYSINGGPTQTIFANPFTMSNLTSGDYTLEVFGSNGCNDQVLFTITQPQQLTITSVSPDITICPGSTAVLTVTGAGGSSAYTYTWLNGPTVLGTGVSVQVTSTTTTDYCVILSEACGSIPYTSCLTVSVPNPITPLVVPDITSGCSPVQVNFTNMSTGGIVTSTDVDYGDGSFETHNGMNPFFHEYEYSGVYSVSMTVTSDVGCNYYAIFPNQITVYDKPHADFDIQPNQVSIFHPEVQLSNNSSLDVVSYNWQINGGVPSSSNNENLSAMFPEGVLKNYDVTLYVVNEVGCIDSITKVVQVISEVLLYAPNAFTPDGDEFNNNWSVFIDGIDIANFHLLVFNRWGEIVWENYNPQGQWDGTYNGQLVSDGDYNWILEVKEISSSKNYQFKGSISVFR